MGLQVCACVWMCVCVCVHDAIPGSPAGAGACSVYVCRACSCMLVYCYSFFNHACSPCRESVHYSCLRGRHQGPPVPEGHAAAGQLHAGLPACPELILHQQPNPMLTNKPEPVSHRAILILDPACSYELRLVLDPGSRLPSLLLSLTHALWAMAQVGWGADDVTGRNLQDDVL